MKFSLIALILVLAVAAVFSSPIDEYEESEHGDRHRRVTCDLLSFGGKVGHSACAANCLSMGKAGGRCNDGVCQCRKTSFKDLWDRRFG